MKGLRMQPAQQACSYSTTLAEHNVHRLRWCPASGRAGTSLFLSVQRDGYITFQQVGHMTMARLTLGPG